MYDHVTSVMYDHVTSVKSVTATVPTATKSLLTEYRCQLQVYVNVSFRARYSNHLWHIKHQPLSSLLTHFSPYIHTFIALWQP